jgi:predicted nucleotidyltransferase component of viral defense system
MSGKKNLGASIRARLLSRARADNIEFNLMLTRYALERLLYRLSMSAWSDQFLLKGALLFDLWFDQPQRPTRDIDLLGFGSAELDHLAMAFREICGQPCEDGIVFDASSVRVTEIRKEANYDGVRITLLGVLDNARCTVQVDVGYGDAVTPAPEIVRFPVLLDGLPQPTLRAYPVYTVVAEKYQAMVSLGIANTRMKDYFDLWILARFAEFDSKVLAQAIAATFERRGTSVPAAVPLGLSAAFADDARKRQQWKAFLSKNKLVAPDLTEVIASLQTLLDKH